MTAATETLAPALRQCRLRLRLSALVVTCLLIATVIHRGIAA